MSTRKPFTLWTSFPPFLRTAMTFACALLPLACSEASGDDTEASEGAATVKAPAAEVDTEAANALVHAYTSMVARPASAKASVNVASKDDESDLDSRLGKFDVADAWSLTAAKVFDVSKSGAAKDDVDTLLDQGFESSVFVFEHGESGGGRVALLAYTAYHAPGGYAAQRAQTYMLADCKVGTKRTPLEDPKASIPTLSSPTACRFYRADTQPVSRDPVSRGTPH